MRSKEPTSRRRRIVLTVGLLAALVAPVAIDRDSFPLSTYPMYSRARSGESTIVTAQGVEPDGTRRTLTPTLIGGSNDPLIVVGELRTALAAGRSDGRCVEIAERVAARSALAAVIAIEVVSERHDTVARTLGENSLIERSLRATCEVRR
ncbi:MAG: hypothetical protein AB8G14_15270 [Ilumatobacter sp.]